MVTTSPMDNQVQSMLPAKTLMLMEDQMSAEALAYEKCKAYEQACQDSVMRSLCENAKNMHKRHFDTLFTYLNEHYKPKQ